MKYTISDASGQKYKLAYTKYDDNSFDLEIWDGKYSVGEVTSTTRDGDTIVLEQITINPDEEEEGRTEILGAPKRTNDKDYKHKHLGTNLLVEFIKCARKLKFQRIYASIVRKDLAKRPFLPQWYKEHGFRECEPYEYHAPDAAIFLQLDLRERTDTA